MNNQQRIEAYYADRRRPNPARLHEIEQFVANRETRHANTRANAISDNTFGTLNYTSGAGQNRNAYMIQSLINSHRELPENRNETVKRMGDFIKEGKKMGISFLKYYKSLENQMKNIKSSGELSSSDMENLNKVEGDLLGLRLDIQVSSQIDNETMNGLINYNTREFIPERIIPNYEPWNLNM